MTSPPAHPARRQPFIVDDGQILRLQFGDQDVQSEMSLRDPFALQLSYTRQMMAFLLFQPYPRHIIIVGLGGGSLTKFCHRQLRTTRITTLEIDRFVIGQSEMFRIPASDLRLRILNVDAVDFFADTREWADVILLDGCDENGIAPEFSTEAFYQSVRRRLRPDGVLVANLCGSITTIQTHWRLISEVFEQRVLSQPISLDSGRIAFAFNPPWRRPDWRAIREHARFLGRQYGLDFPGFADLLERSYQRESARRAR